MLCRARSCDALSWSSPALPPECGREAVQLPEHTGSALLERWETHCDLTRGTLRIDGLAATLTDALVRISYPAFVRQPSAPLESPAPLLWLSMASLLLW